jgi:hypothetical protein
VPAWLIAVIVVISVVVLAITAMNVIFIVKWDSKYLRKFEKENQCAPPPPKRVLSFSPTMKISLGHSSPKPQKPKDVKSPAPAPAPTPHRWRFGDELVIRDEHGEVVEWVKSCDFQTRSASIGRYKKSFLARYIQSDDQTKEWYSQLKNDFLSYRNVRSHISAGYESVTTGMAQIAKFCICHKALCVYLAISKSDNLSDKYELDFEKVKDESVPCLYRITSDEQVQYAKELFATIAEKYELSKGEVANNNYYLPYENNQALLAKGLIKEAYTTEDLESFIKRRDAAINALKFSDNNEYLKRGVTGKL